MSDPFDRLLQGVSSSAPDILAIKSRAGRIQRRRRMVVSSAAAVVALIALGGVLLRPGTDRAGPTLAQRAEVTASPRSGFSSNASSAADGDTAGVTSAQAPKRAMAQRQTAGAGAAQPAAPQQESMAATTRDQAQRGDSLVVTVSASDVAGPRSVRFVLQACNRNANEVTRTFNTGQRYDFDVSRNGALVWRWSDGMAFTQAVGEERWAPGECKTWGETWNGTDRNGSPAPAGTYQVVGTLSSSPAQKTAPRSFCLDIC